ncbi:carbohydrate ABC transporter substrate-binding protein (CUT1 family) [Haloactinopolyspora alba]|uniref:Probable sugar-binding periplasmic protein n=1 Tax=Haloactinopolyspora alba TaxID=648780 RepID=A0A2P8E8S4_9ACTN|nr:ABC transporter substrate-binding protein [Haloactinopolyspora alba]PSL05886.1 carbohydrate ABC transporter substrate-binding protein (CUT1 family) [Haloactinopolyspora alba]
MRRTQAIAALAVVGLTLSACGSDDGESTSGGGGGESGGEVEVFTWWAQGSEKAGLDALVKVFEEQNPDFTFVNGAVAGGAGSNAKNVLQSRLQTNDPPETFQAHAGAELTDYIEANQVQDISAMYEENGWNEVFPQDLLDLLTVDDAIYSVPSNIHRANVVWANPSVLQKAGIDPSTPPASMDDWIAQLEKLKASGVTPLSIGMDWTQVHLLETVLLAELGADAYTGLWDGSTDWASSEVGAAVDTYAQLLSFTNTDRQNLDWPDATQQIIDGKAAYNVMGDWAEAAFQEQNQKFGTDYVTFPVPGTDGTFDFLADSFTLPVGDINTAGTEAWLQTIASPEGQKAFNLAKGSIPARTDVDASEYPPYQQTAIESFANDTIVPSLAHGAATPVAWLGEITAAVSKFSADGDVEGLKSGLVDAAEKNLES